MRKARQLANMPSPSSGKAGPGLMMVPVMDPARQRMLVRVSVGLCALALLCGAGALLKLHLMLANAEMLPPGVGFGITLGIGSLPEAPGRCPGSNRAYVLDEAWVGGSGTFFSSDSWTYMHDEVDPTGGPTQYVDFDTARRAGLIEEGDGWAVMRAGKPVDCNSDDCSMSNVPGAWQNTEGPHLRQSVRITSRKSWRHFLLSVQYTHLPHGCGLWPALWFWCADVEPPAGGGAPRCPPWPAGGEFDLLEYSNYFSSKTSLHLGEDARCLLDRDAVHACGNFIDKNTMECTPRRMPTHDAHAARTPSAAHMVPSPPRAGVQSTARPTTSPMIPARPSTAARQTATSFSHTPTHTTTTPPAPT